MSVLKIFSNLDLQNYTQTVSNEKEADLLCVDLSFLFLNHLIKIITRVLFELFLSYKKISLKMLPLMIVLAPMHLALFISFKFIDVSLDLLRIVATIGLSFLLSTIANILLPSAIGKDKHEDLSDKLSKSFYVLATKKQDIEEDARGLLEQDLKSFCEKFGINTDFTFLVNHNHAPNQNLGLITTNMEIFKVATYKFELATKDFFKETTKKIDNFYKNSFKYVLPLGLTLRFLARLCNFIFSILQDVIHTILLLSFVPKYLFSSIKTNGLLEQHSEFSLVNQNILALKNLDSATRRGESDDLQDKYNLAKEQLLTNANNFFNTVGLQMVAVQQPPQHCEELNILFNSYNDIRAQIPQMLISNNITLQEKIVFFRSFLSLYDEIIGLFQRHGLAMSEGLKRSLQNNASITHGIIEHCQSNIDRYAACER